MRFCDYYYFPFYDYATKSHYLKVKFRQKMTNIFFYKKLLTKIYFYVTMRMNIPMNLLESKETKSGGSSGESRKGAEGARSFM